MKTLGLTEVSLDDERVAFVEAKIAGWAGDMPVERLFTALRDNDIPEKVWPSLPSNNRCLERALSSLRSKRSLIRPLPGGGGWSLVLEAADRLDLNECAWEMVPAAMEETMAVSYGGKETPRTAHTIELTCRMEKQKDVSAVSCIRVTPEEHPSVPLIKQEFERYRGEDEQTGLFKCSQDLSQWFSQTIVPWCRGVATRSRGGSYYIMKGQYLDRIRRVCNALDQASEVSSRNLMVSGQLISLHKVHCGGRIVLKPEIPTTAAVEILIDNIIDESDKACDQLAVGLTDGTMGQRALSTRRTQAEDALQKLEEYETLLDTNLVDVKARLEEVRAGVGMAELRLLKAQQ